MVLLVGALAGVCMAYQQFRGPLYDLASDFYIDALGRVHTTDVNIATPVLAYNLSHDLFAGYVADEHLPSTATVTNDDTTHLPTGDAVWHAIHGGSGADPNKVLRAFNIQGPSAASDNIKRPFLQAVTITKVVLKCDGATLTNVVGRLYEVDGDGNPIDQVGSWRRTGQ